MFATDAPDGRARVKGLRLLRAAVPLASPAPLRNEERGIRVGDSAESAWAQALGCSGIVLALVLLVSGLSCPVLRASMLLPGVSALAAHARRAAQLAGMSGEGGAKAGGGEDEEEEEGGLREQLGLTEEMCEKEVAEEAAESAMLLRALEMRGSELGPRVASEVSGP
eukprot:1750441-Rhodomonas_salina.3